MSLFRRAGPEARTDYPTGNLAELYRRREVFAFDSGVPVDEVTAVRHGAVFSCVDLIARLISTLPLDEYVTMAGILQPVPKQPAVLMSPDGELDISDFNYQLLDAALKHGNAFALIEGHDREGWPSRLRTLPHGSVTFTRKGRIGPVEWRLEGKKIDKYPTGDLWHIPAYLCAGSPVGMSPISFAALTIGHGLAAQQFAARYFRDGAVPTAVLKNEAEVPQALAELVQQRWVDSLAGNRKPQVLGDGWDAEFMNVSANESQFLESIKANTADVCRFFGVMPEDIGSVTPGGSLTYSNVESRQLQLLVRTLGPWIVRLERAWSRLRPRPRMARFNVDEFLRLDTATLLKQIDTLVKDGIFSVNEARRILDRPGIGEAGDRYLWPPMRMQLDSLELELGTDSDSPGATDPDLKPEPEPVRVPSTNGSES